MKFLYPITLFIGYDLKNQKIKKFNLKYDQKLL